MAEAQTTNPQNNLIGNITKLLKRGDIYFALGIMAIIMILLIPIPKQLLDFLLSISITISVLILMTVLFIEKPLQLSSFPTILLIATMLRLALNIATVRLILSHGNEGPDAAGELIKVFGTLVTGNSVLIGGIIFIILTIINFLILLSICVRLNSGIIGSTKGSDLINTSINRLY